MQAEGRVDGVEFYFRARGARWSMSIGGSDVIDAPDWYYEEPYGEFPDAGWISVDQARAFMNQAVEKWRAGEPSMGV